MLRNEYLVFLIEGMKNIGLENNIEDKEGGRSKKKKVLENNIEDKEGGRSKKKKDWRIKLRTKKQEGAKTNRGSV